MVSPIQPCVFRLVIGKQAQQIDIFMEGERAKTNKGGTKNRMVGQNKSKSKRYGEHRKG
jgi:hypothetical protein